MQIGRAGPPVTHISEAHPDRVEVRGRDLTGELMGTATFTELFHLLLTGSEPTPQQTFFLDLLLVSIAEHGMMPTNVAARMTLAADPASLQGAAAGILGAGPVVLGASEECARLLEAARERVAAGAVPAAVTAVIAREAHDSGSKVPGFGHPLHKPVDPRAERILALADEHGVALPSAAVMLDLGYTVSMVKAVPILARTAGLLAHLMEEQENPLGFLLAGKADEAVEYERPPSR